MQLSYEGCKVEAESSEWTGTKSILEQMKQGKVELQSGDKYFVTKNLDVLIESVQKLE